MHFFEKKSERTRVGESRFTLSWLAATAIGISALVGCKDKEVAEKIVVIEGALSDNPELDAAMRDAKKTFGKYAFFPLLPRSSFNE